MKMLPLGLVGALFFVGAVSPDYAQVPVDLRGDWVLDAEATTSRLRATPGWSAEDETFLPAVLAYMASAHYVFTETTVAATLGSNTSVLVLTLQSFDGSTRVFATMLGGTSLTLTTSIDENNNLNIRSSATNDLDNYLWKRASAPGIPARLINVSVRSSAGSGDQTLIVGLVVAGSGSKPLLLRGIGPTLADYQVDGSLDDPRLLLFPATGGVPIDENDDWGGGAILRNLFETVGAFPLPATSRDAAIACPLAAGSYTAHITSTAGRGVALVEAYDAEPGVTNARFVNVSARTEVGIGGDILIAGFYLSGDAPQTLLIRAIGPTLRDYSVGGVLVDPQLALYAEGGTTPLEFNDDWGGGATLTDAFNSAHAFPLAANSKDAALVVTLPPGGYTAQVSAVGGVSGVALVEVYEMPPPLSSGNLRVDQIPSAVVSAGAQ